jgi:hypothetical protein
LNVVVQAASADGGDGLQVIIACSSSARSLISHCLAVCVVSMVSSRLDESSVRLSESLHCISIP